MTWATWYLGCLLKFPLAEPQLFRRSWAQLFLYFKLPSLRSLAAKEADMHPHGGFHLPYMTGDGSSASASYAAAHAIGPWEKFSTGITAMAERPCIITGPIKAGCPLDTNNTAWGYLLWGWYSGLWSDRHRRAAQTMQDLREFIAEKGWNCGSLFGWASWFVSCVEHWQENSQTGLAPGSVSVLQYLSPSCNRTRQQKVTDCNHCLVIT